MEKQYTHQYNRLANSLHQLNLLLFQRLKTQKKSNKEPNIPKKYILPNQQYIQSNQNQDKKKKIQQEEEQALPDNIDNDFDKVEVIDDHFLSQLSKKLDQLTPNYMTKTQIDQLFVRQKKEQEQKIVKRRQQLEKKFPVFKYSQIGKEWRLDYQNQTLTKQDLQTLNINRDLNDAVVNLFLHLIKTKMIISEQQSRVYCFNTYFMSKLIGSDLKDEKYIQKVSRIVPAQFTRKVQENYNEVRRWTKNTDLFQKDFLVIPVNIPNHWNLMMVIHPNGIVKKNQKKPCIVYMDSFGQKNKSLIEAIRIYLKKQLMDKKNYENIAQSIQINQISVPDYQFLLPRQTNYHDCGLYLLTFVESLLLSSQKELTQNFGIVKNRYKLRLFPRSLIFTMRHRITDLYLKMGRKDTPIQTLISQYLRFREDLIAQAKQTDYDQIKQKQFQKYVSVLKNQGSLSSNETTNTIINMDQELYSQKVAFYIKTDYNFFESSAYYHQR